MIIVCSSINIHRTKRMHPPTNSHFVRKTLSKCYRMEKKLVTTVMTKPVNIPPPQFITGIFMNRVLTWQEGMACLVMHVQLYMWQSPYCNCQWHVCTALERLFTSLCIVGLTVIFKVQHLVGLSWPQKLSRVNPGWYLNERFGCRFGWESEKLSQEKTVSEKGKNDNGIFV